MKVDIKQKIDEPLLSRKRIEGEISFSGAVPSKEELKKDIATQMKAQPELVNVEHIYTSFGTGNANILAHVYSDKKSLDFLKKQSGKKGDGKKEEKKEAPKEEKKEDAPKKEAKAEEKPEEKKE
jgi:ribosomal protein S24E